MEGGNPLSYAVVGTNSDGISGSSDVVEMSVDGSSVSCIVSGTDVDAEASESGNPGSRTVVGTNVGRVFCTTEVVETSVETFDDSVSTAPLETSGDVSCFSDAVETSIEIVPSSFDVVETSVLSILVSTAVVETSVGSVSVSCDFAVTSVDGRGVSLSFDVVETSVDGSSGLSLMSSSGEPLVLSITTDVPVFSIISAAKT